MYKIYGVTSTGQVREINEDSFSVNGEVLSEGFKFIECENEFIAAVADGMGGEEAGEEASKFVLSEMNKYLSVINKDNIDEVLNKINLNLIDMSLKDEGKRGMGTTIAGIKVSGEDNVLFNVGDSRGYIYRGGFIRQLTKDHTFTQNLYESGVITREEIKEHPESHLLTQCLGGRSKKVIKPEVTRINNISSGDIIILSSDGLHNKLDEDDMEEILDLEKDIKDAAEKMIKRANELGGEDNITLILIEKL